MSSAKKQTAYRCWLVAVAGPTGMMLTAVRDYVAASGMCFEYRQLKAVAAIGTTRGEAIDNCIRFGAADEYVDFVLTRPSHPN